MLIIKNINISRLTTLTIIGMFLVLISNLGWLGSVAIPFLPLAAPAKELLIPGFIIGGQVLFYLGLIFMGKELAAKIGKRAYLPRKIYRQIKLFIKKAQCRNRKMLKRLRKNKQLFLPK